MIRVLVVDDDATVLQGMRTLIDWQSIGAELPGEAENGMVAIGMAAAIRPDLVLCDIRMPVMDGLTFCERLRAILPETEIILLSAYEDFGYAQRAISFGVREYIIKPIDREKLDSLTSLIRRTAARFEKQGRLTALLYDVDFEGQLRERLRARDTDYFGSFFENQLFAGEAPHAIVKAWCLKLIGMLFEPVGGSSAPATLPPGSRKQATDRIAGMNGQQQMKEYVLTCYLSVFKAWEAVEDSHYQRLVGRVKQIVAESYANTSLSVASIAETVRMSPNYLSTVFHHMTGAGLNAYINDLRMEHAARLLTDHAHSVKEVATLVGFTDPHYFSRAFRKSAGMTPSGYRKGSS